MRNLHYATATLLFLLPITSGFNLLATRPASSASTAVPRLASTADTHPAVAFRPEKHTVTMGDPTKSRILTKDKEIPDGELSQKIPRISRRNLFRCALWSSTGIYYGRGTISPALAYTGKKISSKSGRLVDRVIPDEKDTYAEAQKGKGSLRILWVGPEDLKGVRKSLFKAGNEVVALDLNTPTATDLSAATTYATDHGYQLRFEQGDATKLKFADGTFDVVVSSLFLCQDFDPEVVVSEIRRVLKPGGRFGFYEHVEDIDNIIIGKVFGERSVIRVQAYPTEFNVIAGIVKKV